LCASLRQRAKKYLPLRDRTFSVIPASQIQNAEVREMAEEAESFVASHRWCARVETVQLAWAVAGVLGVFQVHLIPAERNVDDTLWVVVGDLPSAYLALDDAPTWREALQGYVYEMGQWVSAVKQGDSLDDVIPVAVEPTIEHADMLASRLAFIEEKILGVPDEDLESDA
jgi:hypothetical protein